MSYWIKERNMRYFFKKNKIEKRTQKIENETINNAVIGILEFIAWAANDSEPHAANCERTDTL